ncbi:hypothetical protein [Rhodopseudomonas pseudopalustris]|uniref:Uncharacterized protein n=2 Tax=Rhodopseudomonas TaxID=1073 RepID=Q13AC4_RHOPS|nr:hypothetical protein [Rhodopseudomonas pseudopalustris]ABE38965.1 conserved hypothetical protein [Rhodopseudomonas palustris BisB5]MBB1090881.1 hypothetical protein [Rhodopseudomonas palustris]
MTMQLAPSKPPDKIRVLCTKCRVPFREKIKNIREGAQVQCPTCNKLITFSSDSADLGVQRAFTEVRRIKNGMLLSIHRGSGDGVMD